jgi:hypothetical protein
MPLPHFSNVKSHNELFEPIYLNLFEINFILPTILQSENRDPIMLMENATKVGLPLTPDIGKASQKFKFSDREFLLTPEKTSIDVEITFNINQDTNNAMYVWNTLRRWYDLVWNSQTGETFYKKDIVGTIIVLHHDKKGVVLRRVTYNNCQIYGLDGFDLDWSTPAIREPLTAKWISDYWEDIYFDNV